MARLPLFSGRDLVKILNKVGYRQVRQRGSHMRLFCSSKKSVTVPDHKIIGPGLLRKILRDVELSPKEFENLVLKLKDKLPEPLKKYLSNISNAGELERIVKPGTILGRLIDHDINPLCGFFKSKGTKTATRKWIDARVSDLNSQRPSQNNAIS